MKIIEVKILEKEKYQQYMGEELDEWDQDLVKQEDDFKRQVIIVISQNE